MNPVRETGHIGKTKKTCNPIVAIGQKRLGKSLDGQMDLKVRECGE